MKWCKKLILTAGKTLYKGILIEPPILTHVKAILSEIRGTIDSFKNSGKFTQVNDRFDVSAFQVTSCSLAAAIYFACLNDSMRPSAPHPTPRTLDARQTMRLLSICNCGFLGASSYSNHKYV